jgi:hypothetical protein
MAEPAIPASASAAETEWDRSQSLDVQQGDYFEGLPVPIIPEDFSPSGDHEVAVAQGDGIVITHTCHIANRKVHLIAICGAKDLSQRMKENGYGKGWLDDLQAHKLDGFHLLTAPDRLGSFLVVSFQLIYTLPHAFLAARLRGQTEHWTLKPGHRESFTNRFGQCYSKPVAERARVPSDFVTKLKSAS